ncbi:hypothetical protein RMB03_02830 [Acinetobacter sp. V91_7]|uniref:hypothetical protein n=1 Tax=unclassified Acinetobacter TaxID=196816 RepID=UPI00287E740E|nr:MULTISPECIES: hypothetical protein [unclassified Acinetobacter]MDS7927985.1 hypothetical protein [Acinetobacter sp. V102_4]MDS7932849.1 hypothetical protein [Acinetobacter sp. V91_4B]MDS7961892.1 hypothetical protein [Acinetobacter sp. V91_7]MDS8028944.1 hypothetical protein [Acinetobacter sp. V91_13]
MAVVIPSIEELNELEQHLYAQAYYCFGVGANKEIYTEIEKQSILRKLRDRIQAKEGAACTSSILLAELIKTFEKLKESVEQASELKEKKEILSMVFNQYDDAFDDLYGLPEAFIRRVSGLRGVKKRNRKFLDRKYEVFYGILRQYVEQHGKFDNAAQAAKSVILEVKAAFQQFDREYALEKVAEIDEKIRDEKQNLEKPKSKEFPIKPVSIEKRIKKLEKQKSDWLTAMKQKTLYKYFPTIFILNSENYPEEILARHLKVKANKTIYDQIIEKPQTESV